MGLICGGLVLVVPLVALIKASGTAKEVGDLKQKVHRLQDRLNDLRDRFGDRLQGIGQTVVLLF